MILASNMAPVQQIMVSVQRIMVSVEQIVVPVEQIMVSVQQILVSAPHAQQNLGRVPQILLPLVLQNLLSLRSYQSTNSSSRWLPRYQRGRRQWA